MENDMDKKNQENRTCAVAPTEQEQFFRDIEIEFMIHELKDPLSIIETGMRTLLERTERYGPLSERQEKTMKRILRNTKKARSMMYAMLEVGRSQATCFESRRFYPAQTLMEVLAEALEVMAGAVYEQIETLAGQDERIACLGRNGVVVEISPRAAATEILQDEVKFGHIVGNLIKNALHHRRQRVTLVLDRLEDTLVLEVADDGPGVEPKDHETIFRRYAQGKACPLTPRNGHGLGLAGARILARCLGGEIQLISEKGRGATFRLTLPVTFEPPEGSPP